MNEFDEASTYLLCVPDHRELFKTLMTIRNHLEGNLTTVKDAIKKVHEKGCVKVLIQCLLQQRLHIINASLSILGRCSIDRNFVRISVNRYNLVAHLNTLLKRTDIHSIRIRVFRIIGNMCQHWDRFANTIVEKEPNLRLIERIINFLNTTSTLNLADESKSAESIVAIMLAIRTMRELANKETIVRLVDLGVLNAIGVVLIYFTPLWLEQKKHEDVLLAIIRLIYNYSKYRPPKLISELQGAQDGDAMQCLGKMVELCPSVILKVIANLVHITQSRSDLPSVTISESLLGKLTNSSSFTDGYEDKAYREYLKCLCFFINCPAIRENMQNTKIILALLNILKSFENMSDVTIRNSTLIISTLSVYSYDPTLMLLMLQNGITGILVKNLDWVLGPNASIKEMHEFKPKKVRNRVRCHSRTPEKSSQTESAKLVNYNYVGENLVNSSILYRTSSPYCESVLSSGSQSPLSSPNISEVEATESDSDDYSPVCSDVDNEFQLQIVEDVDPGYSPHNDEVVERSDLPAAGSNYSTLNLKIELAFHIVKIVKIFINIPQASMDLINPPALLLKLLVMCFPWYSSVRPLDTLYCVKLIARRPEYLIGLMQTNFFSSIHRMTQSIHELCFTCDELYSTGKNILKAIVFAVEHKCGKGDIAHQLYRGNEHIKRQIVPGISLIVDNRKILHQLMKTSGGLEILLKLILEDSDLRTRSIIGLASLSKKLGIVNPTSFSDRFKHSDPLKLNLDSYNVREDCSTIVFFRLDDDSIVQADRELLCERSVYFNQMLTGMFREAKQDEIFLHSVSKNGLKFLFLLLKLDLDTTAVYSFDIDLQTLLDVIILTDRFLLLDYCVCLTNSVQMYKFSPQAVPTIYKWSLESLTDILRIESVAYLLVCDASEDSRYDMFKSFFKLNRNEELVSDIRTLLNRQLQMI